MQCALETLDQKLHTPTLASPEWDPKGEKKGQENGEEREPNLGLWWSATPGSRRPRVIGISRYATQETSEVAGAWKGPKDEEKTPNGTENGVTLNPPNEGKISLHTPQPPHFAEVWGFGDPRTENPGAEPRTKPSRIKNHPEVQAPTALARTGAAEVHEVVSRTRTPALEPRRCAARRT